MQRTTRFRTKAQVGCVAIYILSAKITIIIRNTIFRPFHIINNDAATYVSINISIFIRPSDRFIYTRRIKIRFASRMHAQRVRIEDTKTFRQ